MEKITASFSKIAEDARSSTKLSLLDAIETIDKIFGVGYAKKHPELVGAFIKATSIEIAGTTIAKVIQEHS